MSKAIFSLFCVAALFNSGLVSGNALGLDKTKLTEYCTKWTEGAGDAVDSLGTFLGGLSKQGADELNKLSGADEGSVGDQALDFLGDALKTVVDTAGKLGDTQISSVCAKVGLKKEAITNNNNGGGNNNNEGGNNNNGGGNNNNGGGNNNNGGGNNNNGGQNQTNQAQIGGGNTNGGNTVQISILGMFILVLAIFNH